MTHLSNRASTPSGTSFPVPTKPSTGSSTFPTTCTSTGAHSKRNHASTCRPCPLLADAYTACRTMPGTLARLSVGVVVAVALLWTVAVPVAASPGVNSALTGTPIRSVYLRVPRGGTTPQAAASASGAAWHGRQRRGIRQGPHRAGRSLWLAAGGTHDRVRRLDQPDHGCPRRAHPDQGAGRLSRPAPPAFRVALAASGAGPRPLSRRTACAPLRRISTGPSAGGGGPLGGHVHAAAGRWPAGRDELPVWRQRPRALFGPPV